MSASQSSFGSKNKIEFHLDGFLSKKVDNEIKRLYISFIYLLEDLLKNGQITEEEFQNYRKQILDSGNGAIRNIQEQVFLIFSNMKLEGKLMVKNLD